jgi:hypothetical protein
MQGAGRAVGVLAAIGAGIGGAAAEKPAIGPRDDVDHAAHGRAAVLRGTGALDHLDVVDLGQQVLGDVDGRPGAGRDWQAVDQDQHLVAGHALQGHLIAGLAVDLAQLQARHVLQRVLQRAGMRALDLLTVDDLRADRRFVERFLGTGACHDDCRQWVRCANRLRPEVGRDESRVPATTARHFKRISGAAHCQIKCKQKYE